MDNRYNYAELERAALNDPNPENLEALAEWFYNYDPAAWNGEEWQLAHGERLRPIYEKIAEDEYNIIGYELL